LATSNVLPLSVWQVPLHAIIQEIMERHATGISFREWMPPAGQSALDGDMSERGMLFDMLLTCHLLCKKMN